jgi:hypothetical protein
VAGLQIETPPLVEPVSLSDMKNWLRVPFDDDDTLISDLITAARELCEIFTSRALVNTGYVQTLDSFPYFVDTVMSQMANPPSYYSLPRYSTTLWNYSQMIKLFVSPLQSVTRIAYLSSTDQQWHSLLPGTAPWYPGKAYASGAQVMDGNGNLETAQAPGGTSGDNPPTWSTLTGGTTNDNGIVWTNGGPAPRNELSAGGLNSTTFFSDTIAEPPRIFPGPAGSFWPPVLYVPNAVQIHYVAGYGPPTSTGSPAYYVPPTAIPNRFITAIQQLVGGWYENREAITPLSLKVMPQHLQMLLWSLRVYDMQPTRG